MDLFDNKNIGPMLIDGHSEPFDDPDYIYELKQDGERCLAYLSADGTDFRNKRHKKMNVHVPELTDIHKQTKKKCILDGELMVMKDGVPDFSEIQRRSITTNKFKIELAAKQNPATFVAFDILYFYNEQVTDLPLMQRKKLLQKAFKENERLALSRYIEGQGIALFNLAKEQKLEGIVGKRKDSIYKMNSRTKDWTRIKFLLDDEFVVCGYIIKAEEGRSVASIILGAYQNGRLIHQGHVTLGMSRQEFDVISKHRIIHISPFDSFEDGAVYIEPTLVCTVRYMKRTKNGGLRQAVFKGLRFDKEASECVLKP